MDDFSAQIAGILAEGASMLDAAAGMLGELDDERREALPRIGRLEAAIAQGQFVIGRADPDATPEGTANGVRTHAQAVRDAIAQFSEGQAIALEGAIENLLSSIAGLRAQPDAELEQEAKNAALRYKQSLDPRMRALSRELGGLEERLAEIDRSVSEKHTQHHESVTTEVNELGQRLEAIKTELDGTVKRVDELIGGQDSKFTEAQENRRVEFEKTIRGAQERLAAARAEYEKRRSESIERLGEVEEEITSTAAALGGRATAFSHGDESSEQSKRAFRWSVVTIILLLAAAVVPITLGVLEAEQSAESLLGKLAVALIIAGVAGYTGGLARHHRERAATARRLEIELNAFSPFVAPLEREDRNDLRSTIIWRFFGPPDTVAQEPDTDPRPGARLLEILHLRRKKRAAKAPSEGTPDAGEA